MMLQEHLQILLIVLVDIFATNMQQKFIQERLMGKPHIIITHHDQEILILFIKLANNMKSIGDPDSDQTLSYVLKAVKNTAINFLRKNGKRNEFEDHDFVENIPDRLFLEKLNIKEQYNEVVNAIRNLNDPYRDVMFYHFVSEMKIGEIADLLGRKRSTVQQQLVRGKKKLIEILKIDLETQNGTL